MAQQPPKASGSKPAQKPAAPPTASAAGATEKQPGLTQQTAARARALLGGPEDAPETVRVNRLRKIIVVQAWIILVLGAVLASAILTIKPQAVNFAVHEGSKPKPLLELSTPNYTEEAVLSWVGTAASDILNFGFHNVDERLGKSRVYFTDPGWESFVEAIKNSKLVDQMIAQQQVLTAAPVGAPVIIKFSDDPHKGMSWTVQVPFTITMLSGKEARGTRRILTLTIIRVPPSHNLSGLGIDVWKDALS